MQERIKQLEIDNEIMFNMLKSKTTGMERIIYKDNLGKYVYEQIEKKRKDFEVLPNEYNFKKRKGETNRRWFV